MPDSEVREVLLFSDGLGNFGDQPFPALRVPLYTVTSAVKADPTLLRHLARRCMAEGLPRLQWWVLDWNKPSIAFYKSLGAEPQDEWTVFRVSGEALDRLAL